jgi:hypothetical protein
MVTLPLAAAIKHIAGAVENCIGVEAVGKGNVT